MASKAQLFACFEGSEKTLEASGDMSNNRAIIKELEDLMKIYQAAGDKGKVMGYRRAVSSIKAYKKPITNADQMDEIPYVGDGIKKKVKEFLAEGKMSKKESLQSDERLQTLALFSKVWGIGPSTAANLVKKGFKTIEDLRKRTDLLTA